MSRSIKKGSMTNRSWYPRTPDDPPGTEKAGARGGPRLHPRNDQQGSAIQQRRSYGRTEKILRRNRKIWTRLFSKIGRRLDKQAIIDSTES